MPEVGVSPSMLYFCSRLSQVTGADLNRAVSTGDGPRRALASLQVSTTTNPSVIRFEHRETRKAGGYAGDSGRSRGHHTRLERRRPAASAERHV